MLNLVVFLLTLSCKSLLCFCILAPVSISQWKPMNYSDISCPTFGHISKTDYQSSIPTVFKVLTQNTNHYVINGFICSKLKYEVLCSESFFGHTTIHREIKNSQVLLHECTEEYFKQKSLQTLPPYFPAVSCLWMQDFVTSKEFVIIKPHPVTLDPYTDELVDELFVNGKCNANYCPLYLPGQIWFSETDVNQNCSFYKSIPGDLLLNSQYNIKYFSLVNGLILRTDHMCVKEFCGDTVILTDKGIGIKLEELYNFSMPNCLSSQLVKEETIQMEIDLIRLQEKQYEFNLRCTETKRSIVKTSSVDFLQLTYFQPLYEGPNPVYRINQNKLERAHATWIELSSLGSFNENCFGKTKSGHKYCWTVWVRTNYSYIVSGYNGVHKNLKLNRVMIPELNLLSLINSETLILSHDLQTVEHPNIIKIHEQIALNQSVKLYDTFQTPISEWIGKVFNTIGGKIVAFVLAGVIIGIMVYLLKIAVTKRTKELYRQKTREPEQHAVDHMPIRTSSDKKLQNELDW